MSEQNDATQGPDYLAKRDAGVEQAMTWAAEIAALQVENTAAHVRIAELEDANAKILQTAVDRIGELEARIMTLQSFPVPRVSTAAFPFSAIRHSR